MLLSTLLHVYWWMYNFTTQLFTKHILHEATEYRMFSHEVYKR